MSCDYFPIFVLIVNMKFVVLVTKHKIDSVKFRVTSRVFKLAVFVQQKEKVNEQYTLAVSMIKHSHSLKLFMIKNDIRILQVIF